MKEITKQGYKGRELTCYLFDEVRDAKGVVVLVHGMQEHALRYLEFGKFLNDNGYILFATDLRGHGKNMLDGKPGFENGDIFENIVEAYKIFISELKNDYKNLPIIVFGHSFGSFISQRLLLECDNLVDKFILCGSAYTNSLLFKLGKILANITKRFKGAEGSAKLVESCSIGGYGKKFKNGNWLTRDENVSEEYKKDPLCGRSFPAGFYQSFFNGATKNYKRLAMVDESTPILIISGDNDPVGLNGKSIKKLNKVYTKHWLNVYVKMYKDARHELLNELNKDAVMDDILEFIEANNKVAKHRS